MKSIVVLIAGLLIVGCAISEFVYRHIGAAGIFPARCAWACKQLRALSDALKEPF